MLSNLFVPEQSWQNLYISSPPPACLGIRDLRLIRRFVPKQFVNEVLSICFCSKKNSENNFIYEMFRKNTWLALLIPFGGPPGRWQMGHLFLNVPFRLKVFVILNCRFGSSRPKYIYYSGLTGPPGWKNMGKYNKTRFKYCSLVVKNMVKTIRTD